MQKSYFAFYPVLFFILLYSHTVSAETYRGEKLAGNWLFNYEKSCSMIKGYEIELMESYRGAYLKIDPVVRLLQIITQNGNPDKFAFNILVESSNKNSFLLGLKHGPNAKRDDITTENCDLAIKLTLLDDETILYEQSEFLKSGYDTETIKQGETLEPVKIIFSKTGF